MGQPIQDRYYALLKAYALASEEECLAATAELGRELVLANVPPEEIAEIHEEALNRLAEESPDMTLVIAARQTSAPLMELFMAYGLVFRARIEALERSQRELRESRETARALLNAPIGAAILTDAEGTILAINETGSEITGKSPDQLVGLCIYDVLPSELAEIRKEHILEGARSGEPVLFEEEYLGRVFDSGVYPLLDPQGKVTRLACFSRDITEHVRLEERWRQAEKMETVGRLAGGIAHDFNNLLTVINGYAEILKSRFQLQDPRREEAVAILEAGRRAAQLTRQLLIFSRKQIVRPRMLDLNQVVRETEGMLRRLIGEHIEIRTILAPDLWSVRADPVQIEQVIINLAVNAGEAMPRGGVLTIKTANASSSAGQVLGHGAMEPGRCVVLSLSDNGIGMSEEVQAHVFEPFFTTKQNGTGLGLATVYGIVQQRRGNIRLHSKEGEGTTIEVYLPRASDESEDHERETDSEEVPEGKETVLLVEDEEGVRRFVATALERAGYAVLMAENAQEALEELRSHAGPIHMLLTDVIMPGLSGRELVDEISEARPELKVLYMSGYPGSTISDRGGLDPDAAFIQKPFTLISLTCKVRDGPVPHSSPSLPQVFSQSVFWVSEGPSEPTLFLLG